jgi:hypothetical protein
MRRGWKRCGDTPRDKKGWEIGGDIQGVCRGMWEVKLYYIP